MIEILSSCTGCGICVPHCPFGAIKIVEKKAQMSEACTLCGACVKACPFEAIKIERKRVTPADLSDYREVWVFAEQRAAALETLSLSFWAKGENSLISLMRNLPLCLLEAKLLILQRH